MNSVKSYLAIIWKKNSSRAEFLKFLLKFQSEHKFFYIISPLIVHSRQHMSILTPVMLSVKWVVAFTLDIVGLTISKRETNIKRDYLFNFFPGIKELKYFNILETFLDNSRVWRKKKTISYFWSGRFSKMEAMMRLFFITVFFIFVLFRY